MQRTIPCPLSMAGRLETGQIYHLRHNYGFIRFHSNELFSIFFLKAQLKDKDLHMGAHVKFECVKDGSERLVAENIRHVSSFDEEAEIQIRKGVVEKLIVDRRFKDRKANVFGFVTCDDVGDINDVEAGDCIDKSGVYFNMANVKDKSMKT